MRLTLEFSSVLWVFPGKATWYFVTLPENEAAEIKFFQKEKRGFGSVRVDVTVGNTTWQTSVFPDKRSKSYILPVKSDIRKKELLDAGDKVNVAISFEAVEII